jgi:hypothetical protein
MIQDQGELRSAVDFCLECASVPEADVKVPGMEIGHDLSKEIYTILIAGTGLDKMGVHDQRKSPNTEYPSEAIFPC